MPRYRSPEAESAGQDSFLDVVTNIVGILIILVMVIGGRVQQLVFDAPAPVDSQAAALAREIETLEATVAIAENEVQELVEQG